MSERIDLSAHELLADSYPIAKQCIDPLVEIVKVNPWLAEQVIEIAIVIGIGAAFQRVDFDKQNEILDKIRKQTMSFTGFK